MIDQLNDSLVIEGRGIDVELDEVASPWNGREASSGFDIWQQRDEDQAKIWLARLPYRVTQAGQEGGEPISIDEMTEALLLYSDEPVVGEGSICHTDGVKAYNDVS